MKQTDIMLLEKFFQPMGFNLQVMSNSSVVMKAAQASFGGFGRPAPTESPDLTFHLFEHHLDEPHLAQPTFRTDANLVYQTTQGISTLVADRQRGAAYGYFSKTVLNDQPYFRWHFLEMAFFVMLASRGVMGVHGAAIAKNGRALLLRAAGGGGKTTLAYAAARRRFQALAEDVVWIDIKRNRWWGMPWHFHLLPDAKTLFPELANHNPVLQTNREFKLEVELEQLRPGCTTVSARPGPVVLVQRAPGQKSRLEPLAPDIAKPVWLRGFAGAEMDFPDYQRHVDALLRDNAYLLYSGDVIEASLDLLEELFDTI